MGYQVIHPVSYQAILLVMYQARNRVVYQAILLVMYQARNRVSYQAILLAMYLVRLLAMYQARNRVLYQVILPVPLELPWRQKRAKAKSLLTLPRLLLLVLLSFPLLQRN